MSLQEYTLNQPLGRYEKNTLIFGNQVRIAFDEQETALFDLEEYTLQIENRLDWVKANKELLDAELFALYPGYLEDEDDWEENPISEQEFVNRIQIQAINFFQDLSFQIFYNDGDTFWGHSIIIEVNENCDIDQTTIWG
ncbi:DUF2262 domain-containing protein [Cytophagaceae bacterium DM2B3-1]|uniref:DUF2262 domain-containing protein n=1 Tax=Xanthocytophaga flava TaxID=3048013 RepID=A0ABT7CMC2_9BACT|nr:DUF2262 domain-containing protein [Xanthocytophaga flavus]MDJ1469351.1 DUF2262 domain-containing protein [Xanthocytophaga flavus]MDJ1494137.1 DUF2262 domain-containing protein [Xanthocytophaga flavus]